MALSPYWLLSLLGLLLAAPSQATVNVDQTTCGTNAGDVQNAISDAIAMAQNGAQAMSANPRTGDAASTRSLFATLFDDADAGYVGDILNKASKLQNNPFYQITIYCSEDVVHFDGDKNTDNTRDFYVSAFKDKNGGQSSQYIGSENPVQMPRKTLCERDYDGYTVNGLDDHDGQVVIVLCPSAFASQSPEVDTRRVTDIKTQGLQPDKSHLAKIWPLSKTILHEFCHTKPVCGIDSSNQAIILDGPGGGWYGFTQCRKLKTDQSGETKLNADSYSILGLGLYLQFPNLNPRFTWATGGWDLAGNKPFVPQRTSKLVLTKRMDEAPLEDMVRETIRRVRRRGFGAAAEGMFGVVNMGELVSV